jgi:hypothetical protein
MLRTPSRNVGGANAKTAARCSRNGGPVAVPEAHWTGIVPMTRQ